MCGSKHGVGKQRGMAMAVAHHGEAPHSLRMRITLAFMAAFAGLASTTPANAADDLRARQATEIFANLCVATVAGVPAPIADGDYRLTRLDPETSRELGEGITSQPLTSIEGIASGVMMLMHYEPAGMCVVQVAAADEVAMTDAFLSVVERTAKALGEPSEAQPVRQRPLDGLNSTYSSWRMKSPKGDLMFAITTYPEPKFMIQHMMTISYVR